jgi:hypothetical protein
MANERELELNRKNAQAREEEVARLAGAVESAKKSLVQHESDLATMKSHVSEEESAARSKMNEVEAQIATARSEREVAAARVDAAALKRYSTIRMRRGMALAAVKGGTCQGCHMNIPPQLFNILQRGVSIEMCPNCNRIIYWDRLLADPDGEAAEKKSAPREVKPKRAPKAAAPQLPSTPPPPDPKRETIRPVAAAAGSEPGALAVTAAETLRSSSDASPDTATGPSTAPAEADAVDENEPEGSASSQA